MVFFNNQNSIRAQYQNLRVQAKEVKDSPKKKEFLQQMIELIQANPTLFKGPEDEIRALEARKSMIEYREEQNRWGPRQVELLRKAAEFSKPTSCEGKDCPLEPQHCAQKEIFSTRQKKMCIERINAICAALKIEAAVAARRFDYHETLAKRREAVRFHQAMVEVGQEFDPINQRRRLANQRYLEYWCLVTEGYVSLLAGEFDKSREYFKKALEKARLLPLKACFPNYFYDVREIQAHQFFINGIEKVKLAQFAEAGDEFQTWLDLRPSPKRYLRFDNIGVFRKVCNILALLVQGKVTTEDWKELGRMVDDSYIARTTWALLSKVDRIREISFRIREVYSTTLKLDLKEEVNKIAEQWQLFIPDAILLGEDRTAGLKRPVTLLSFTDMFDQLDEEDQDWQGLLSQNLKNLLLIMADYEHLRYMYPPPEGEQLPRENHPPIPSEKMTIENLKENVLFYLNHRSRGHATIFQKALQYLDSFELAIRDGNFHEAVRAEQSLFETVRSWPHVIYVREQRQLPSPIFFDEDNPNLPANRAICSRLWNTKPDKLIIQGPQKLEVGQYYYLRPRWNMRMYDQFEPRHIRHERFLQSDVPRWINVFFENIFGPGQKVDPKRFRDWILQFGDSERLLACKLFDALEVYDEDKMRQSWADIFDKKLPPEVKTGQVVYVGTGHGAKSGRICPYYFRQGVSKLPEYESYFEPKKDFRDIAEFASASLGLSKPRYIVFLDDFIGTGGQAVNFLNWYFEKYSLLEEVSVYYCTLCGFEKAVNDVKERLGHRIKAVIVGRMLFEKDRAFTPESPLWKSEKARIEAKKWAEDIGRQVVPPKAPYDPERDKLGWYGCQALITFHHNIPSDTLPIFWGSGERNGKKWKLLWERYD